MLDLNIVDIQKDILGSLTEILSLSYGTETYRQILSAIEKTVRDLEHKHKSGMYWH